MQRALAFTLALVVGALTAQPVLSQDAPEPTKIGFVEVRTVFERYWKRANIETQLRARTDALESRIKSDRQKLEDLGEELNTLNEDSDEYRARRREIEILRFQIKMDQEQELGRIQREARRQEALLYKDVVRECEAFGESRGYAAILLTAPLGPEFDKEADLDIVVATRTVLWHDSRLNATDQVLEFLNAGQPK